MTHQLLSIKPREMKAYVHKNPCTRMFIIALFLWAKTWQVQASVNSGINKQQINQLWYIQTMEPCSTIRKTKLPVHASARARVKGHVWRRISQTQSAISHTQKARPLDHTDRMGTDESRGRLCLQGVGRVAARKEPQGGDSPSEGNVLYVKCSGGTQVYTFLRT